MTEIDRLKIELEKLNNELKILPFQKPSSIDYTKDIVKELQAYEMENKYLKLKLQIYNIEQKIQDYYHLKQMYPIQKISIEETTNTNDYVIRVYPKNINIIVSNIELEQSRFSNIEVFKRYANILANMIMDDLSEQIQNKNGGY